MFISRLLLLLPFLLSGCAVGPAGQWPLWAWPRPVQGEAGVGVGAASQISTAAYAHYRFEWQLSGDPEIMPVQVFDDGERMWLQFAPEGAWPAIFDVGAAGWRPLAYRRDGPYMVLEGIYEQLELRGGHLRGGIRRPQPASYSEYDVGGAGAALPVASTVIPERAMPVPETQLMGVAESLGTVRPVAVTAGNRHEAGAEVALGSVPGLGPAPLRQGVAWPDESLPPSGAEPQSLAQGVVSPEQAAEAYFSVSPADNTIRQALERWALSAGWMFAAEHWAVDVDIPLVGQASFDADFKTAVRELLAATEMGDRPLQPCFYSNHVLRVVPHAQSCDRRSSMGAMS